MKQEKYEYAFGQWVLAEGGYNYRYLGKDSHGNGVLYLPDFVDIYLTHHSDIRPNPDPPELVPGQLVMFRDDKGDDWKGPDKYVGYDKGTSMPHVAYRNRCVFAKPYIPAPQKPAPEPAQLDAIRAELVDLKAHIQKIEQRLPG